MNCLLASPEEVDQEGRIIVTGARAVHVRDVLKKMPGEHILAGILNGPMGPAEILEVKEDSVMLAPPRGPVPPEPPVDLILAMPRPKVMKRLWAPLASLGVRTITIIGAERVEPFYFDSHALDEEVFRPRLIEGLQQARDTRVPRVTVVKSFAWFAGKHLSGLSPAVVKLVAHPGSETSMYEALRTAVNNASVMLAVGPEGGWTPREISCFTEAHFVPVGLHERTLRTDTAVIALLALVYEGLGQRPRSGRS